MPKLTEAEINAARTPRGGWTRAQLAKWGVSWPPPKGWRRELLGKPSGYDPQAGWNPIGEVEKMKHVILFAYLPDEEGGIPSNYRMGSGFWHVGYESDPDYTAWCWEGRQLRPYDVQPTHWRRLPKPPGA